MPGHLVSSAPRRVSRNRSGDLLAALLTPVTRTAIPDEDLQELLLRLAGEYFASIGSVTNGIRTAVEIINELLYNSAWVSESVYGQTAGTLNLAVLHGSSLFVAHVGHTHSILFAKNRVADLFDPPTVDPQAPQPEIAGVIPESVAGLGSSKFVQPRFYQEEIKAGDLLIQCARPSPFWSENELVGSANLAVDSLRRRLLLHPPLDLYAALLQFTAGKGEVHRLQPRKSERQTPIYFDDDAILPEPEGESGAGMHPSATPHAPIRPTIRFAENLALPGLDSANQGETTLPLRNEVYGDGQTRESHSSEQTSKGNDPDSEKMVLPLPDFSLAAWQGRLEKLGEFFISLPERMKTGFKFRLPNLRPMLRTESTGAFPSSTLLFIAIAVPVLVVAIATTIYFRSGKSEQRQAYLLAAQQMALQAAGQQDVVTQRKDWTQTLYWVDKAEEFGRTDDTRYLHEQAQTAIDTIDGVVRLPMQLAVATGLPSDANITKIAAASDDVFALDSNDGHIIRLTLTNLGYEVDPKFICGPGPSGAKTIGPLIDLFVLPPDNQFKASLVAIDRAGNLLYCIPGESPLSTTLTPPDTHWGKITAYSYQNNTLYILDPLSNAVWRYGGSNYGFGGSPHLFFDQDVPNLSDVIDLTVYQDDLYLLHKSGKTTVCTFSGFDFSPTRCSDPAPYGDPVSGKDISVFENASFIQLLSTQPPDPSLYYLDTNGPAIYHFSLRLNLEHQYRFDPNNDSPDPRSPVTAVDIASNRVLFLAYGNELYYSTIP